MSSNSYENNGGRKNGVRSDRKKDVPPSQQKMALKDWLGATFIIALSWQLIVWVTAIPTFILPGPWQVMEALFYHAELIASHAWITALEVIVGLVLGAGFGVLSALYLTISARARQYAMPVLVMSQTVPVFALAPILTLWFGYGLGSKIAMTILIIYFPVTSTFLDGLRATPKGFLDLGQSMRATRWRSLFLIRVPAALPSLSSGIRLASVYAPIGAIIGEWVGASKGLGYLMLLANGRVKTDLMFATLIALCIFTLLLRAVTNVLCSKLDDWAGQSN